MCRIKGMDKEHWFLLSVVLGAFAGQVAMLDGWGQLAEPRNVGPMLAAIAAAIRLMLKSAPEGDE